MCDPEMIKNFIGEEGLKGCKVVIVKAGGHTAECCGPQDVQDCCGTGISRKFISKAEKLERLEAYRDQIAKELDGVEEEIAQFKKG